MHIEQDIRNIDRIQSIFVWNAHKCIYFKYFIMNSIVENLRGNCTIFDLEIFKFNSRRISAIFI